MNDTKRKTKEIVAEQLDLLMKQNPHLGTQMKLAKKTGIGQTTIGRIRRGEVNATAENLRAIADAFSVTVGFLYGEETIHGIHMDADGPAEAPLPPEVKPGYSGPPPDKVGQLPLISWVRAGNWSETIDNFAPGDAEEWIPCPFKHSRHAFILQVVGKSMYNPGGERSYNDGDYIAVDPCREAQNGSLVVVRLDDDNTATFKQLLIEPNGERMLMALNPSWPNRIMHVNANATICGVVIGKWTKEA
ncbi:LexA family protein [Oxalobacter paraformigenes]|uniref:HTH cro/C1-type domain-containing protein n=1 Tax=Oxalobacter paraformigenes TaxID=556268 RepID=C3X3Q3_9BURK|nr:S24 family peptidase [Oxalobacter paraformigenes]EEO27839.1 hypothetical protein OFAG_00992 [Oxalobacter paraformigenes]